MTFKDVMEGYQKTVEAYLQTLFAEDAPQKQLFDAMRYSLLAGGKRIRPILTLEFCRVCGGDMEKALPFAAAMAEEIAGLVEYPAEVFSIFFAEPVSDILAAVCTSATFFVFYKRHLKD